MAGPDDAFAQMTRMWSEGSRNFMEAQRKGAEQMAAAMSPNAGGDNLVDTWRELMQAWVPGAPAQSDAVFGGPSGADALANMMNPMSWTQFAPGGEAPDWSRMAPFSMDAVANFAPEQLRDILDSVAQGPRFADLASPWMDAAQTSREWLDYQKAAMEFAAVLRDAWGRAYAEYARNWSLDDLKNGDVNGALDAWLKAANAELLSTQRSSAYLDAQKRLLRAGVEVKVRTNEAAERWADAWNLPTRSEVDDMGEQLHKLRGEVRALKKELKAATGTKKAPTRRTSTRKSAGKPAS